MIVSLFEPKKITKGDRADSVVPGWVPYHWKTTWAEFVETLRDTAAIEADPAHKSAVMSFSCAEFAAGTNRAKANVLGCDLIGFDFDDKIGDTAAAWKFDALVEFMEQAGVSFLVHTTASCRKAAHCLRLLLPLDRRVGSTEYPQVWSAYNEWLGSVADAATKDVSRLFFEPRKWVDRYNRFHAIVDRPPVCVDEIVAAHPSRVPDSAERWTAARVVSGAAPGRDFTVVENITDLDISPIISRTALEKATSGRPGGRMFGFLCSVARVAKLKGIALSESELIEIGEALAWRIGRRHRDDIPHDAANALRFADRADVGRGGAAPRPRTQLPRYW